MVLEVYEHMHSRGYFSRDYFSQNFQSILVS